MLRKLPRMTRLTLLPQRPDPSQLHDARVEPICRKYLELRYRLLPYLYSAVRECCTTGMPVMRALWLHYPDDPGALACGDEYLFGKNILVAAVVEKGAAPAKSTFRGEAGTISGPMNASKEDANS